MSIKSICLLVLIFQFFVVDAYPFNRPGKDYALFFANDDYSMNSKFDDLKNSVKDAEAIAKELKDNFGFETQVNKNFTKKEIYRTLEEWQKKSFDQNAQLFVFFSGHGTFWDVANNGYFVPKTKSTDHEGYIELKTLGNIITKINCPHILLAIDACYSGAIVQEIAFGLKSPSFQRPRETEFYVKRIININLQNRSRLILTSGGKERTPDGTNHSPFAWAILKGLRDSYTGNYGILTYFELLGHLEKVNPRPRRGELINHEGGGFVFVKAHHTGILEASKAKEDSISLLLLSRQIEEDKARYDSISKLLDLEWQINDFVTELYTLVEHQRRDIQELRMAMLTETSKREEWLAKVNYQFREYLIRADRLLSLSSKADYLVAKANGQDAPVQKLFEIKATLSTLSQRVDEFENLFQSLSKNKRKNRKILEQLMFELDRQEDLLNKIN